MTPAAPNSARRAGLANGAHLDIVLSRREFGTRSWLNGKIGSKDSVTDGDAVIVVGDKEFDAAHWQLAKRDQRVGLIAIRQLAFVSLPRFGISI